MNFQKNTILSLALSASVLSLGACGFVYPNAMPSGYTHHHQTYKSPAPVATPTSQQQVTIEQREYMNAEQAQQFRDGIYNLLERLTMRAGMPPKPVYVLSPEPMTSFYTNLDNDLRASMRHIGYNLADTPNGAYVFTYDAMPITATSAMANNVELTLRVFNGLGDAARQLTEETGQFYVQGANKLSITPARYTGLPTVTATPPVQQIVAPVAVPAPVPQVIQAPVTPIVAPPVVTSSSRQQQVSQPVIMAPTSAPVARLPLPSVEMPKINSTIGQTSAVVVPPRIPAVVTPRAIPSTSQSVTTPKLAVPQAEIAIEPPTTRFEAPQYSVSLEEPRSLHVMILLSLIGGATRLLSRLKFLNRPM